jgi:hypothetical protein
MDHSIPTQLRFPARAGFTIRAEFDGGAMSSDFGVTIPRQSRGLSFMSRSKRLNGVANAAPPIGDHLKVVQGGR